MRSLCAAILFSFLIVAPIARAQDQPLPAFSLEELDNKLKGLESKAEADARFKDTYSRSDIDAKIQDIRNALAQGASRSELDARISDLQKIFDSTEKRNSGWRSDVEKRVSVLENKAPPISPWIAVAISALALCASGFGIYWSSRTSNRVAEESREEARRAAREARADNLVNAWQGLSDKVSNALGLFEEPGAMHNADGSLNTPHYNLLIGLGNWYDRMAAQWRNGSADPEVLRKEGLKIQVEEFWKGLAKIEAVLPDIRQQMDDWDNLQWLATTPGA
jgi:hypothetical protein